jgi:type II secretory pathway component GspD/PulD (secretin)
VIIEDVNFRDPEERSTKSMVRIKDGETVIIGGLIRNEVILSSSKLPFFGDIPLIGALFRHKGGANDKNRERELLVFITPHVIKEKDLKLTPAKVALPEREQGTFSGINRDMTVASMLNTLEQKY